MASKINHGKVALIVFVLVVFNFQFSRAQTFGEFFNQKKTQKKYLLQQIATLQVYLGYAKKGYDIARNGLQTVKEISGGEFSLHSAFVSSLKTVSPAIRNNVKVARIIQTQIRIAKAFDSVHRNNRLSLVDQLYIQQVQGNLIHECEKYLEELLLVITSGKLEMSDSERLRRINLIYEAISDKYAFTMDFTGQVLSLIYQADNQQESIDQLRRNYGIE